MIGAIGVEETTTTATTLTPGSGYTALTGTGTASATGVRILPEAKIVSATAAYAGDGTLSISKNWAAAVVTYKLLGTVNFRSAASGDWNSAATWQQYNGSTWVAASTPPTSADGTITILSGHTVTVTANVTVDQVVVQDGGQLTVNSGVTLTLVNGGTDLQVDSGGTLIVNGSVAPETGNMTTVVGSGEILGGNGTIIGSVVVADGGTVSPGNSVETITVTGDETFQEGSTYFCEIGPFPTCDKIVVGGILTLVETGVGVTLTIDDETYSALDNVGRTIMISDHLIVGTFAGLPENAVVRSGYHIHYNLHDSDGRYHVTINTENSASPTSSGIDLRAYDTAEGVVVEFTAYDVEEDGEIEIALLDDDGQVVWSGTAAVTAGPEQTVQLLVPGLQPGGSYSFRVKDEVGNMWTADNVTVGAFTVSMVRAPSAGAELMFNSVPGRTYEIQWTGELGGEWQTVDSVTAGETTYVVVPYPAGEEGKGFFRIQQK